MKATAAAAAILAVGLIGAAPANATNPPAPIPPGGVTISPAGAQAPD